MPPWITEISIFRFLCYNHRYVQKGFLYKRNLFLSSWKKLLFISQIYNKKLFLPFWKIYFHFSRCYKYLLFSQSIINNFLLWKRIFSETDHFSHYFFTLKKQRKKKERKKISFLWKRIVGLLDCFTKAISLSFTRGSNNESTHVTPIPPDATVEHPLKNQPQP